MLHSLFSLLIKALVRFSSLDSISLKQAKLFCLVLITFVYTSQF